MQGDIASSSSRGYTQTAGFGVVDEWQSLLAGVFTDDSWTRQLEAAVEHCSDTMRNRRKTPLAPVHRGEGMRKRTTCQVGIERILSASPSSLSQEARKVSLVCQESTSRTAFVPGATMRIGRATFDRFCFWWSIPSASQTVASNSDTPTGRFLMVAPSGPVSPIT